MISALSALSLLKWPLTVTGAVLVFGLSSEGTLSLVSSNAHKLSTPIKARTDFNVPPVKQIGDLRTPIVVSDVPAPNAETLQSPQQIRETTQVAMLQEPSSAPEFSASVERALRDGNVGSSAVNVRSGPSKGAGKLGSLAAGAQVRIGEQEGGWVHVWYDGGDGWIYSTYLANTATASTAIEEPAEQPKPKGKAVKVASSIPVRARPDSTSRSMFRLEAGEHVQILERRGTWLKVLTVSGDTGWIHSKVS